MLWKKTQKVGPFFSSTFGRLFSSNKTQTPGISSGCASQKNYRFQKSIAFVFSVVFLFAAFGPSFSAAGEALFAYPVSEANTTGGTSETAQKVGELANFLVSIFTPIVSAEAGLISFLMNNGFILGEGKAATSEIYLQSKTLERF
jgi:hypothetical protein